MEPRLLRKEWCFRSAQALAVRRNIEDMSPLPTEGKAFSTSNQANIAGHCRAKGRGKPIGDIHVLELGQTPLSACLVLLAIRAACPRQRRQCLGTA